jgi:argininosuccinate synthase
MAYAKKRGIPVPTTIASPYSIDDNLWGRAIECGVLEDPWVEPPADIYTLTSDTRGNSCDEPEYAEISFEQGVPVALDGELMSFHEIINRMNEMAGKHGFGRIDMIENRLVGLKSREIYEVPGALTLIQAHKALEDLCLEREVLHFKLGIEQKWAELVYNGLWFSPLKEALDGKVTSFHEIINAMNDQAGRHGFGRIDMIENRLIGVKSREIYEVPGALTLIQAHKALEDLCLEREVLHYKLGVEQKWAELVYNGLWFSPLKEALDGFVDTTQKLVTGDVRLRFFKGSCVVVGRRSPYSLYDYNLATYDAADTFDHKAAKGFIDLWGLPTKVWARQRRKVGKEGEV